MDVQQAKARIEELTSIIEQHNYNYYVLNAPTICDYEFDKLMAELIELEKQFPHLVSPYSPTQRVGGTIPRSFSPLDIERLCYPSPIHIPKAKSEILIRE
jgi:DNA ligase (NAD+)